MKKLIMPIKWCKVASKEQCRHDKNVVNLLRPHVFLLGITAIDALKSNR